MTIDYGSPPISGWAKLVPELLVDDLAESLSFWIDGLGFRIAYQRPEEGFAYLERQEGAQIMLCKRAGHWETAPLEPPYGRGAMFQIYVNGIADIVSAFERLGKQLHAGPRDVWRRYGDREGGKREIFVLDPNGYLIMIAESLGERPLSSKQPT